jgi:hypothetical protein
MVQPEMHSLLKLLFFREIENVLLVEKNSYS